MPATTTASKSISRFGIASMTMSNPLRFESSPTKIADHGRCGSSITRFTGMSTAFGARTKRKPGARSRTKSAAAAPGTMAPRHCRRNSRRARMYSSDPAANQTHLNSPPTRTRAPVVASPIARPTMRRGGPSRDNYGGCVQIRERAHLPRRTDQPRDCPDGTPQCAGAAF